MTLSRVCLRSEAGYGRIVGEVCAGGIAVEEGDRVLGTRCRSKDEMFADAARNIVELGKDLRGK